MSQVDYADVQGLVRFGYGHMTSASYALVRVKNAACGKSLAPLCSDHHRGCAKAATEHCDEHRGHGAWPQSARRSGINHCRFFA